MKEQPLHSESQYKTQSTGSLHMLLLMCYLTLFVLRTTWAHSFSVPISFFGFPEFGLSVGNSMVKEAGFCKSLASLKLEMVRGSIKFQFVPIGSNLTLWIPVCPCSVLLQI